MKKELKENVEKELPSISTELFEAIPELQSVSVHGYTPGFNDGDPCYHQWCFDADEMSISVGDGESERVDEFDRGSEFYKKYYDLSGDWPRPPAALVEFGKVLAPLGDTLLDIYDTDTEITFHRDGSISVSDYDCGY